MHVHSIDHIVINVTDVEQSARWYVEVLGMRRLDYGRDPQHPRTAMLFGDQRIYLRPVATSKAEWFTADRETAGSDDLCFLTDASPTAVIDHLSSRSVEIVSGPDIREGARGRLRSVYWRDPDGNLIEIASYEG